MTAVAHIHEFAGQCVAYIGYVHLRNVPFDSGLQRAECTRCPWQAWGNHDLLPEAWQHDEEHRRDDVAAQVADEESLDATLDNLFGGPDYAYVTPDGTPTAPPEDCGPDDDMFDLLTMRDELAEYDR